MKTRFERAFNAGKTARLTQKNREFWRTRAAQDQQTDQLTDFPTLETAHATRLLMVRRNPSWPAQFQNFVPFMMPI
jgi:hypothetical protein